MDQANPLIVTHSLEPAIVRIPLDYLKIYDVTEDELAALENGSPVSVYMNALVLCFSTALSFLTTLLTVDIQSIYTFTIFVVIAVIGFLASGILGLLWCLARGSAKTVAQKIRERSQPVGSRTEAS